MTDLSLTIVTPPFDKIFIVEKLEGTEGLSTLFKFSLFVSTNNPDLETSLLLGRDITIRLSLEEEERFFSGIISSIEEQETLSDESGNYRIQYLITMVPKIFEMTLAKDSQIFQNQSIVSIISDVLDQADISNYEINLSNFGLWNKACDICIQYNETPFDFISRLMEEHGIFYYFKHFEDEHTLVLADSTDVPWHDCGSVVHTRQHDNQWLNVITHAYFQEHMVSLGFQSVDYNYMTPSVRLMPQITQISRNVYEYPGKFQKIHEGELHVKHRLQELEWNKKLLKCKSTLAHASPGVGFELENHPRASLNQKYYVHSIKHTYHHVHHEDGQKAVYENEFVSFLEGTKFRPPRITPKPRIHSHQTAIVTGPDGYEIYCDRFGRIKIWFHWDTYNEQDETSSCWVRVAQNWAGSGFGGVVIPRIGMEVVVCFTEGDPDRPLVMGCVYHAENEPPPYPALMPTISTFKTNSSPGGFGYNELRFNDLATQEEIFMHAQKDVNVVIEDSRTELFVTGNDTKTIKLGDMTEIQEGSGTSHLLQILNGDQTFQIEEGNRYTRINSGNRDLKINSGDDINFLKSGDHSYTILLGDQKTKIVTGNKTIKIVMGDYSTTILLGDKSLKILSGNHKITLGSGNMKVKVNGNISFAATGNISLKAAKNISLKAGISITNKAGLKIKNKAGVDIASKAGVNISNKAGTMISNKAGLQIKNKSLTIKSKAGLLIEEKAGLQIKEKAGLKVTNKAGLVHETKSGLDIKIKSGLMLTAKSGLMSKFEGGVISTHKGGAVGKHEGGACAIVKGAVALIN